MARTAGLYFEGFFLGLFSMFITTVIFLYTGRPPLIYDKDGRLSWRDVALTTGVASGVGGLLGLLAVYLAVNHPPPKEAILN